MRLIDADKARTKLVYFTCPTGIDEAPYDFGSDIIDNQPTVDAIPIEWLKRLQVRYLEAECNMSVCVVNEILNLWEKENEQNKENTSQTDQEN